MSEASTTTPMTMPVEAEDEWQIIDGLPTPTPSSSSSSSSTTENDTNDKDINNDSPNIITEELHQRRFDSSTSSSISTENKCDDEKVCRICQDNENSQDFISPCRCKGSMKFVHKKCLEQWRTMSSNPKSFFECDQCKFKYHFSRTKAGDILASKWALHLLTFVSMVLLMILIGYVAKGFNLLIPSTSDDLIVEVNENGDIIIKNTTDSSSSSLSSSVSTWSRIWQFLRIDFFHLFYGTILLGLGGFLSLFAGGGMAYHFGGGWRTRSNDRGSNAIEMIILGIIVMVGLIKASYSVYEMVEKRVNRGLLNARNMVVNIQEGEN